MNKPEGAVRTRHPKATTRATILSKAYEMYVARELVHGDERLSLVLDELGYTTGAGYQIWANQAAFREDLQVYIAENIEYASLERLGTDIAELAAQNLPWPAHQLAGGDLYFDAFIGREEFYLTLRFYAMDDQRPEAISTAVRDAYERLSWETEALFNASLERFRRRIVSGFEMRDLIVATCALLEGYALRHRMQPAQAARKVQSEGGEHYSFSVAFLGLLEMFTEPVS